MAESLLSVGIDLGTSTTQLIFSKLHIENRAGGHAVPKMEIAQKEILYKSPIHFTPLLSPTQIDTQGVRTIIENEYRQAGFLPKDTDTGAVIITGETARKENARAVLNMLSAFSGDFVVATAGADLESVLSAKGAGIDKISKQQKLVCANLDIGGGTTNIAVYNRGKLQDTACYDIGGRLLKYDSQKNITYISPKLQKIIDIEHLRLQVGKPLDLSALDKLLNCMVIALCHGFGIKNSPYHQLLITHKGVQNTKNVTHISVSGGVAEGVYNAFEKPYQFGDIGLLLGEKLRKSALFEHFTLLKGNETLRATVVGAGSHTTNLSGSTVYYDPNILPLKNLQVTEWDIQNPLPAFEGALAIKNMTDLSFQGLTYLASRFKSQTKPLVLLFTQDIGKSFGYILKDKIPDTPIISTDSLQVQAGDFIDIGLPAADGTVLPVVIKTLLFQ